jgi:hypothetical protein
MTSTLPRPRLQTAALEQRQPIVNQIRMRALERLYARRDAVEALIQSLEDYEETRQANRAKCLPCFAEVVVRLRSMANFTSPTRSRTLSFRISPAR